MSGKELSKMVPEKRVVGDLLNEDVSRRCNETMIRAVSCCFF